MKQNISKHDFREAFRVIRPDNFTYEGLGALYDYFVSVEEDCGVEIELDVIAICCEYSEDSIENALERYGLDSLEDLCGDTTVIEVDSENIIYLEY